MASMPSEAALEVHEGETAALFGSAVMATQYAETIVKTDIRLADPGCRSPSSPTVSPSALFAKQGSPLQDMGRARRRQRPPLTVSSLQRATAAYCRRADDRSAREGLETHRSRCATRSERSLGDVTAGRTAVGIIPTNPDQTKQLDQPADRSSASAPSANVILKTTPTFAEVTGDPKDVLHDVDVFASPKLDPGMLPPR